MADDSNEAMDQLTAHLDRGWDLAMRGDLDGAQLSAEKSLELDAESPEARNLLGFVLNAQGHPEDAIEQFTAALELDESYVDAMLNAADVLLFPLRDFDEALRWVDEALDWLEEDETDLRTDALLLRFDVLMARGDREAAERVAKQLPEGPFENPQLYLQVGRARFDAGDVEAAEPLVRRAIDQGTTTGDAFHSLGMVLEAKGDRRGALVSFLSARDLDLASPQPPWAIERGLFERLVRAALDRLSPEASAALEGALVVVTDAPGAEVVADGVDPRLSLLLDDVSAEGPPRVGRIFVYQRNVERAAAGMLYIEEEILRGLADELRAVFPGAFADEDAGGLDA
jgi:tetratricopeptide (TPR) repeat protein